MGLLVFFSTLICSCRYACVRGGEMETKRKWGWWGGVGLGLGRCMQGASPSVFVCIAGANGVRRRVLRRQGSPVFYGHIRAERRGGQHIRYPLVVSTHIIINGMHETRSIDTGVAWIECAFVEAIFSFSSPYFASFFLPLVIFFSPFPSPVPFTNTIYS